jgi:hypothetical protein
VDEAPRRLRGVEGGGGEKGQCSETVFMLCMGGAAAVQRGCHGFVQGGNKYTCVREKEARHFESHLVMGTWFLCA